MVPNQSFYEFDLHEKNVFSTNRKRTGIKHRLQTVKTPQTAKANVYTCIVSQMQQPHNCVYASNQIFGKFDIRNANYKYAKNIVQQ